MQEVEIRVRGQIDPSWSKWLEALSISHTAIGETALTGTVRDQSALYGLIERLSGLGLELVSVSVRAVPPPRQEVTDVKPKT